MSELDACVVSRTCLVDDESFKVDSRNSPSESTLMFDAHAQAGFTALMRACAGGFVDVVNVLITAGAQVDYQVNPAVRRAAGCRLFSR